MRIPFFRIFYSTTFTILSLFLAALLLITPIDQIYQAFSHRQFYNIAMIAGIHLLTFLVAVFLYASRLFANRTTLAKIPRSWSPTEKGDVKKRVRLLVAENLKRSAIIAYKAHPRDCSDEITQSDGDVNASDHVQRVNPAIPVWGIISHPGWSPPSSPDLPNLHYDPVIIELPHLIEAKAVSLAPADPLSIPSPTTDTPEPPLPDPLAVELLQRPTAMGLRDYISHLTSLDMINPPELANDFCSLYEQARFSAHPLTEPEFRNLMSIFAEILRGMTELSPEILAELYAEEDTTSHLSTSSSSPDRTSIESSATVQHIRPPHASPSKTTRSRATSRETVRTAASSPREERPVSRSAAASRRRGLHTPSRASLRSVRSNASSILSRASEGSVIRLAEAREPLDLPYTIIASSGREK